MMGDHTVDRGDIKFRPGKGVEINSADDDFQLRIRVRVQMLYTYIHGEPGPKEADEPAEHRNDFRLRRARFVFQGHFFGKHNQYKLEIDPLRKDNVVLDYYLDFTKNRDIQVRVGQYKISSNRQRVISSGNLQMVDRSRINAEFSLDRDMGIDIRSRDFLGKNKMRYVLGVSTGNGLNNPSFTDFAMVFLARVEYLPLGIFRDMSEVDFARTKPRLAIGATYSFFDERKPSTAACSVLPFAGWRNCRLSFRVRRCDVQSTRLFGDHRVRLPNGHIASSATITDMDPDVRPGPSRSTRATALAGCSKPAIWFRTPASSSPAAWALIQATRSPTSLEDSYAATGSVSWYFRPPSLQDPGRCIPNLGRQVERRRHDLPAATPGLALACIGSPPSSRVAFSRHVSPPQVRNRRTTWWW